MAMRRQTVHGVVYERPFIEVCAPMRLGAVEVLGDLRDRLTRGQFVRSIRLEESAFRPVKAVILKIADVAPWTA